MFSGLYHLNLLSALILIVFFISQSSAQKMTNITYTIREEVPSMTVVGRLKSDLNLPDSVKFHLIPSDSTKGLFQVNPTTGVLTTSGILDRDVICPRAEICDVTVDVGVMNGQFSLTKIGVIILDENDNAPRFSKNRIAKNITEGAGPGFVLPIQPAWDPDSPVNGIVRYTMQSASKAFELHAPLDAQGYPAEPRLLLTEILDRERQSFYQVKVIAIDGGKPPKSGSIVLDLTVTDLNDNSPKFSDDFYEVEINENQKIPDSSGLTLITLSASDADEGINGLITYEFSPKTAASYSSKFLIHPNSGEIKVLDELDYEEESRIVLEVIARDGGAGSIPATTKVYVNINDVNDNYPVILIDPTNNGKPPRVAENSNEGTFVTHVSVTDRDSGDNHRSHCTLTDPHFKLVDLHDNEYKIITKNNRLDQEKEPKHSLIINCTDQGNPALWTVLKFDVIIDDENDNSPMFTHKIYNFTVLNRGSGSWIGRVVASDPDLGSNGRVMYGTVREAEDHIRIDSDTGIISTARILQIPPRESKLKFQITAYDSGENSRTSTAQINIEVIDPTSLIDDPRIYQFKISENLPAMSYVGRFNDNKIILDPTLTYELEGFFNNHFELNNCSLYTARMLDREFIDLYHLRLVSISNGFPFKHDVIDVLIHVTDVNDHPPVIKFPTEGRDTVQAYVGAPEGQRITRIDATDSDIGENGRLTYNLINSKSVDYDLFRIDSDSGEVFVNSSLLDHVGTIFRVMIVVNDNGSPVRSAKSILNIVVSLEQAAVPGKSDFSMVESSSASNSNIMLIIIVTIITLVLILAILVTIVICRRRRDWSPADMTSEKSLSRKSDVTQVTSTTLQSSMTSSHDFPPPTSIGDLYTHAGILLEDDLDYLDCAIPYTLKRPSPITTPSWRELGQNDREDSRNRRMTDYNSLKRNFLSTQRDNQTSTIYSDWMRGGAGGGAEYLIRPPPTTCTAESNTSTFLPPPSSGGEPAGSAAEGLSSTLRSLRYGEDHEAGPSPWRVPTKSLVPPNMQPVSHSSPLRSPFSTINGSFSTAISPSHSFRLNYCN